MKLSKFKFDLPEEQIALFPAPNRDDCRLMVLNRQTGEIEHRVFKELIEYFDEKDVFVFNDTKVFPACMYGNKEKTNARIQVFLLRELNASMRLWDVLVDPARKIRIGNKLYFGEDNSLVAEVIDNTTSRGRTLRFLFDGDYEDFRKQLYELGETPLPPHIREKREVLPEDEEMYQTIFAKNEGAVVAPAAGLHFSKTLMKRLEIVGCEFAFITMHAGLGNFRNIDVEDLTKHKMDSEEMEILADQAEIINRARMDKKHICAVGTTCMRAIETSVGTDALVKPFKGWTNKFIFPPYQFSVADRMITNFHLPMSTLMMLVSAFGGYEKVSKAYDVAVKEGYKFGSYGDAMLII